MYIESFDEEVLPQTLTEATVTLLPKKGKDLEEVGSYRPISLLNSDQKILAKTLARRLGAFMCKLVHPDQTGFIPQESPHTTLGVCLISCILPDITKKTWSSSAWMLKKRSIGLNGHTYFQFYRSLIVGIDLFLGLNSYIMGPEPEYFLTKRFLIPFC